MAPAYSKVLLELFLQCSLITLKLHAHLASVISDIGICKYFLLRSSVMDQVDPNNISGLLKLHLRENHLLSSKVVAQVSGLLSRPISEGVS